MRDIYLTCPSPPLDRCASAVGGVWEELPNLPEVTFMHAVLMPSSSRVLFWGYGPRPDQARIWDQATGLYNQLASPQRGINMDGTALLLPLRPPHYEPRIMVAGGTSRGAAWTSGEDDALRTAEWIDLSVGAPAWQALPDMNVPRDKMNSVLLPDGRVLVLGGYETPPDGGPVEIFDPDDPAAGFQIGPNMKHARGYHSAAILLPDGSVVMGGDPNGGATPNERYRPSYFFKARPAITVAPVAISHGAPFTVGTSLPASIAEVVLISAGAVTHGFNQNQRLVGCVITGTTATGVEVLAPPDHTLAPHGWYMVFLVDRDRTPSVAAWLRVG